MLIPINSSQISKLIPAVGTGSHLNTHWGIREKFFKE